MKLKKEDRFVFDAFAVIAFLLKEEGSLKVEKILRGAEKGKTKVYFNEINLGEVYYRVWKDKGEEAGKEALSYCLSLPLFFVPVDRDFILKTSEIKARNKVSYADAFCIETAKRFKCPVVTADPEFLKIEGLRTIRVRLK